MSFSAVQKIPQVAALLTKWENIYHSSIIFQFPNIPGPSLTGVFPHSSILACYSDIGT